MKDRKGKTNCSRGEGRRRCFATFSLIVSILLLGLFYFILFSQTRAQVSSSTLQKSFGGRILTKVYCNCDNVTWITVGPPVPGSFIINTATKIYREYQIEIGRWVLGNSIPTQVSCRIRVYYYCVSVGAGFPVTIVGTSGGSSRPSFKSP